LLNVNIFSGWRRQEDVKMKLTAFGAVVGDRDSGSFGLSVHKTLEEATVAFEHECGGGGEDDEGEAAAAAAAGGGQSCMFASVYETPFEDIDAAARTQGKGKGLRAEGVKGLLTPFTKRSTLNLNPWTSNPKAPKFFPLNQ
jgi:hypothetical protein